MDLSMVTHAPVLHGLAVVCGALVEALSSALVTDTILSTLRVCGPVLRRSRLPAMMPWPRQDLSVPLNTPVLPP